MSDELTARLNQILPRITTGTFLSSEGIGKEIACYIFDYPAQEELRVREYLALMQDRLATHHKDLSVLHLNLLDVMLSYLEHRKFLKKSRALLTEKGDVAVLRALRGPLASEKLRDFIASQHDLPNYDLVIMSGVGSVWPAVRAHGLLNCLHTVIGSTPLVMFYPGSYDRTSLRLFGRIEGAISTPGTKAYYRAFPLVPGGTPA